MPATTKAPLRAALSRSSSPDLAPKAPASTEQPAATSAAIRAATPRSAAVSSIVPLRPIALPNGLFVHGFQSNGKTVDREAEGEDATLGPAPPWPRRLCPRAQASRLPEHPDGQRDLDGQQRNIDGR